MGASPGTTGRPDPSTEADAVLVTDPAPPGPSAARDVPLVVDLDGTLVRTDTLHESTLRLLRDRPVALVGAVAALRHGKAAMKRRIADLVDLDPTCLPYDDALVAWLTAEKAAGRRLVLCTAADARVAAPIAAHVGLFDTVMASDGTTNLAGHRKAAALDAAFGRGGYDYVGNAAPDRDVWSHARHAIVANASASLVARARADHPVERVFDRRPAGLAVWARMLRVHQWLKNALLFVPLLAAHSVNNGAAWVSLLFAFVSFSLCASSVYIANDLLDLESDRRHPRKRARPFASGTLPIALGIGAAPVLLLASVALAALVGPGFTAWLIAYFVVTCLYSWSLKRLMLVDCLTLAILYTLRIVAGAAAVRMPLSFWLLAFSVFLFLSLAFVKRYAELEVQIQRDRLALPGRGYVTTDAPLIQSLGVSSGYASVLVLALYLNSEAVLALYRTPHVMWGTVPVMLYWISRMWMLAHRGQMHDDPLVFAVKDRASQIAGLAFAAVLVIGSLDWPW